jgi:hypothetical protein
MRKRAPHLCARRSVGERGQETVRKRLGFGEGIGKECKGGVPCGRRRVLEASEGLSLPPSLWISVGRPSGLGLPGAVPWRCGVGDHGGLGDVVSEGSWPLPIVSSGWSLES